LTNTFNLDSAVESKVKFLHIKVAIYVIFLTTKMQGIGIPRKFFVKNQKVETHYSASHTHQLKGFR